MKQLYHYGISSANTVVMDMLGNTFEWIDESGPPVSGRFVNKVVKGGGGNLPVASLANWLRNFYPPPTKTQTLGFRCAMDVSA